MRVVSAPSPSVGTVTGVKFAKMLWGELIAGPKDRVQVTEEQSEK